MRRKWIAAMLAACLLLSLSACTEVVVEEEVSGTVSQAETAPDVSGGTDVQQPGESEDPASSPAETGGQSPDAGNSNNPNNNNNSNSSSPAPGNDPGTTQTTSGADNTPSKVDLRTAKFPGVTLQRIRWYDMGKEETQMVKDWEAKTGAKISDVYVNFENVRQKLQQSIAAKDPIDIGLIYGGYFTEQVISNMFKPVNEYIKSEYLVDLNNLSEGGFHLDKVNEFKWKNNYYGLCSYWDVDMLVMYYRTDIFDDYGMETPNELAAKGQWNWDTFYQAAKDITDMSDGRMVGYSNGPDGKGGHITTWVSGAGSAIIKNASTNPTVNTSDPLLTQGLEFYQKLAYGPTAVIQQDYTFNNGKAAMCLDGMYQITKMMADSSIPAAVKNNWDFAPVPVSSSNKTGKYPVSWLKSVGIVNGSKNPDAVASYALFKSKYKGDNKYDEYLSDEQKARVEPYYKNIAYANHGYGELNTKFTQMCAQIAAGDNIAQLLASNASVFQSEIDKVLAK